MAQATQAIADKVRGVAAENRLTQQDIADILGISRTSVADRFAGRIAYTAPEIHTLAVATSSPVQRFFPEHAQTTPVLDAVPDPGVEGGGSSVSAA